MSKIFFFFTLFLLILALFLTKTIKANQIDNSTVYLQDYHVLDNSQRSCDDSQFDPNTPKLQSIVGDPRQDPQRIYCPGIYCQLHIEQSNNIRKTGGYDYQAICLNPKSAPLANITDPSKVIAFGPVQFSDKNSTAGVAKMVIHAKDTSTGNTTEIPIESDGSYQDGCSIYGLGNDPACIGTVQIQAPASGSMVITMDNPSWFVSGTKDTSGFFVLTSGTKQWTLSAGGKTNEIDYQWQSNVSTPQVSLSATTISTTGNSDQQTEHVTVTFPDPKLSKYTIKIANASSRGTLASLGEIYVTCDQGNGGKCSSARYVQMNRNFDPNSTVSNSLQTRGSEVTFDISASILTEGGTYTVTAFPDSDTTKSYSQSFSVSNSNLGDIQVTLNPSSFANSDETKGAKITVTLGSGATTEDYKITSSAPGIFVQSFKCNNGPDSSNPALGCHTDVNIASNGAVAGTYTIEVDNITTTGHFGKQTFVVSSNSPTTNTLGICTTVPSDPAPSNCSDLQKQGLKISDLAQTQCTTGDGRTDGVQCPNATDQFCTEGSKIRCAALTTCTDNLVCPTGYSTSSCLQGYSDQSKPCCAKLPDNTILAQAKVACSLTQSTTSGAQPCDPTGGTTGTGIKTAIGCIPTQPQQLVQGFVRVISFAAGGIALLLMIFGAIGIITSAGNPEKLKHSQEQFTSAIIGLLFIIFSVLLLQIIGVDILNIPGFGR